MKRMLALLMVLLLTGCAAQETAGEDVTSQEANIWGITLKVEDVTPGGAKLVCSQSGGQNVAELMSGQPYHLEVQNGVAWESYPARQEKVVWTMEGWMIPIGGQVEWRTDWTWLYGKLPAGTYRIGKNMINLRGPGDYDEATCYAEFTIE